MHCLVAVQCCTFWTLVQHCTAWLEPNQTVGGPTLPTLPHTHLNIVILVIFCCLCLCLCLPIRISTLSSLSSSAVFVFPYASQHCHPRHHLRENVTNYLFFGKFAQNSLICVLWHQKGSIVFHSFCSKSWVVKLAWPQMRVIKPVGVHHHHHYHYHYHLHLNALRLSTSTWIYFI